MTTYSRRKFLKTAAATAAGITIVPNAILGKAWGHTAPSNKLNIAGIGIGGMGRRNLANMNTENIVALCDVDWGYAAKTFNDYPKAERFKDWRVMFDEMGKTIDAVMVAIPDHTHAGVTAHVIWNWRGFWDFRTGALGDMACHIMNPLFWPLDLKYPTSVSANSTLVNLYSPPQAEKITYKFPERPAKGKVNIPEE